jgi:hypothetical protein
MKLSFYVMDAISIASFLADFLRVIYVCIAGIYIEYAGMLLPLLIAYSSNADADSV